MDAFDALALWRRTAGPDAPVPQPILDVLEARHPGAAAKVRAATPVSIYPDAVPAGEEGQLQRDCEVIVTDLVGQGILVDWWHRPWGRHRHAAKGRERSGLPDFLLAGSDALRCPCCGSAVAGTELKSGKAEPGPYQQRWLGAFGRRGAVCRSVEAFWGFLRGWGVTLALLLTLTACAGYEVRDEAALQCPPGMVPVWVDDGGQLGLECALAVDDCACRGVEL